MALPGWLAKTDFPQDSNSRYYVDETTLDYLIDQYQNWRGNVNAGGYNLSNIAALTATGNTNLQALVGVGSSGGTASGKRLTVTGAYDKATATDNVNLALLSSDAIGSNPLSLALGVKGHATGSSRYGYIQALEHGLSTYRNLVLNPSGGYVGIGTAAPVGALHVVGIPRVSGYEGFFGGCYGGYATLELAAASGAYIDFSDTTEDYLSRIMYDVATRAITWTHLGVNRFTILTSGNVGISKAAPNSAFAVVGLPTYASNSAAISGGLTAGDFYRTSTGIVMVVY